MNSEVLVVDADSRRIAIAWLWEMSRCYFLWQRTRMYRIYVKFSKSQEFFFFFMNTKYNN